MDDDKTPEQLDPLIYKHIDIDIDDDDTDTDDEKETEDSTSKPPLTFVKEGLFAKLRPLNRDA